MQPLYSLPVVVIITSNASKTALFRRTLSSSYYLLEAEDVDIGLNYVQNMGVDIIILDGKIPDLSLHDLCERVRKIKGGKNIPILLISNNLKMVFIQDALEAGISDFLREPLDPQEVQHVKMAKVVSKVRATSSTSKGKAILEEKFWIDDKALQEISQAKKTAAPLQILMIAVDHYKKLQGQWGERAVEEALLALSHLLKNKLRKMDTLLPQGKGKFLLMLPKTSARASALIAETIRKDVSSSGCSTSEGDVPLTVSIGVVSFDQTLADLKNPYEPLQKMLTRVDDALGKAKKTGNKIVFENLRG
jgi:diguanylate cyclase (GGDEF)-like protein